jgi:hypothetical protein
VELRVRPLRRDDDRSTFRSGDASLDVFFAQYAGQHQFKTCASVTYVVEGEGRVAGYVIFASRRAFRMGARSSGEMGRRSFMVRGQLSFEVTNYRRSAGQVIGSENEKVVPRPSVLSTVRSPPWCWTIP